MSHPLRAADGQLPLQGMTSEVRRLIPRFRSGLPSANVPLHYQARVHGSSVCRWLASGHRMDEHDGRLRRMAAEELRELLLAHRRRAANDDGVESSPRHGAERWTEDEDRTGIQG